MNLLFIILTFLSIEASIAGSDLEIVENKLRGLCRNIMGVNFRSVERPDSEIEKANGVDLSTIQPNLIHACVKEMVDNNIIFEHETNNVSTVSLDLDREKHDGDLSNYSFNIQNIRKVLTNRFGDQMLFYDFNRIQSIHYDFEGTASMRFGGGCEGWLSYSHNGHTYWTFLEHLEKQVFIPSLDHSFVDFSRLENTSVENIDSTFFGVDSGNVRPYGKTLSEMQDSSLLHGRSYDQSYTCRYYFEDLANFALGSYVQKSDMRKVDHSMENYHQMDFSDIGVIGNENVSLEEQF